MIEKDTDFDFEKALKEIREGKPLMGKEGILTPLVKKLTKAALEGRAGLPSCQRYYRQPSQWKK